MNIPLSPAQKGECYSEWNCGRIQEIKMHLQSYQCSMAPPRNPLKDPPVVQCSLQQVAYIGHGDGSK